MLPLPKAASNVPLDSRCCLLQGMGYLVSHDICEFAAHATQHLLDTAPEVSTVNLAQVQGPGWLCSIRSAPLDIQQILCGSPTWRMTDSVLPCAGLCRCKMDAGNGSQISASQWLQVRQL